MLIYFTNLFIILVLGWFCINSETLKRSFSGGKIIFSIASFTLLAGIMGFRNLSVGIDTAVNARIYCAISETNSFVEAISLNKVTAPVYILFCRTLSHISKNPQVLSFATAVIINAAMLRFVMKKSLNYAMSVFCWIGLAYLYFGMNGTRQAMAIALTLNAIATLDEDMKSLKGWGLLLICIGIHATSIAALPILGGIALSKSTKSTKRLVVQSLFISLFAALLLYSFAELFARYFPRYAQYVNGVNNAQFATGTSAGRSIILYAFLSPFWMIWSFAPESSIQCADPFCRNLIPSCILFSVIGILNATNQQVHRLMLYYMAFYIVFIPNTIEIHLKRQRTIAYLIVALALCVYSTWSIIENKNGIVPYEFFWQ